MASDAAKKPDQQDHSIIESLSDDKMIVQLSAGQLRVLLREEVDRAVSRVLEAKPPAKSIKWFDVADVADHFKVTPQTIRNWCKNGAPHRTYGAGKATVYRINLAEFEPWVTQRSGGDE